MTDAMARPQYDADLNRALDGFPPFPLLNDQTLVTWRQNDFGVELIDQALEGSGVVREERVAPGPHGEIPLMVLRPAEAVGSLSALYAIHGGGMVLGNRFGNILDLNMLHWIRQFGLVVISPEYHLAPEFPAPVAVEDCYAGLEWVAQNATGLGVDPDRIIVSGISGGGALAAGAVLMARDNRGPGLLAQLLIYPMLDDRNSTTSARQYAATTGRYGAWPTENNAWAWNAVLGQGHEDRDVSIYSAPARATDLSRLPQTFLDVGAAEVFRDEVVAYASGLWASGTQAELHVWAGAFHGFDLFVPTAAVSRASHAAREDWLRRILAR